MIDYIISVKATDKPSYFVHIYETETKLASMIDFEVGDLIQDGTPIDEVIDIIKEEIAGIVIERIEDRFEGKPYYETGMTIAVRATCWDDPSIPLGLDEPDLLGD